MDKVRQYIEEYQMIREGDRIIAGLSGGADSVYLLLALEQLGNRIGFELRAVHVEHGIRGEESVGDARFCEDLCKKHGIPLQVFRVDALSDAKERGISLEEAARELRYRCFWDAVLDWNADAVAVAHHADDNAETMLFHMARGTGIRGLGGIAPVAPLPYMPANGEPKDAKICRVIRPLLILERREIEQWLVRAGQEWRTDATNAEDTQSRNYIRNHILPELVRVNDRAVPHLLREAEELSETARFLEELAENSAKTCAVTENDGDGSLRIRILCEPFLSLHPVIRKHLLLLLLERISGERRDITSQHIRQVMNLFAPATGKRTMLPYDMEAVHQYGEVILRKRGDQTADQESRQAVTIPVPGILELKDGAVIRTEILEFDGNFRQIPKNRYTKWFDYDKIKFNVQLRTRQLGDYFLTRPDGGRRKLKNYFIDEKIPAEMRDDVLLLADADHVIWAVGYRISEGYKITRDTTHILCIRIEGGTYDE